jgi:glycine/D-amino acid oxidase-like deaminating enzyme
VWDLRERAAALASTGVRHTTLCPRDVRALEPGLSDAVVGALLIPSHGYVNVSSLVLALVRAAGAAGATFSRAHAKAIDPAAAGVRIVTEHGPIDAAAVVLTAGSWLSQLRFGDALLPALVKPVRGQLLHLRLPQRPASRVIWRGPSFYAVPWADGSVLVGATVEDVGFDERHTPEAVSWLREGAAALLPGMAAAVQQDVRVGLRPGTPDGLPLIGPSTAMRNVFYATGHYRNGVLLAPLTAALVADLVLEGRRGPGLEHTRPDRFGL